MPCIMISKVVCTEQVVFRDSSDSCGLSPFSVLTEDRYSPMLHIYADSVIPFIKCEIEQSSRYS